MRERARHPRASLAPGGPGTDLAKKPAERVRGRSGRAGGPFPAMPAYRIRVRRSRRGQSASRRSAGDRATNWEEDRHHPLPAPVPRVTDFRRPERRRIALEAVLRASSHVWVASCISPPGTPPLSGSASGGGALGRVTCVTSLLAAGSDAGG